MFGNTKNTYRSGPNIFVKKSQTANFKSRTSLHRNFQSIKEKSKSSYSRKYDYLNRSLEAVINDDSFQKRSYTSSANTSELSSNYFNAKKQIRKGKSKVSRADSVQDLVNVLTGKTVTPKPKNGVILYKALSNPDVEIGIVDLKVPDLKGLNSIEELLNIKLHDLCYYCELLNDPIRIKKEDFSPLESMVRAFNDLKLDDFNKVLGTLKRHQLLNEEGIKNINQLVSISDRESMANMIRILLNDESRDRKINLKSLSRASANAPFNKNCLPSLSFILEKVRIKRPLTDQEEQRLASFIRDLIGLPTKTLFNNLKMVQKNGLLTKRQLETLVQLMPHYSRVHMKNGSFAVNNDLFPARCRDLSHLIDHWPNLQENQSRRFCKYLKDLSSLDVVAQKNCLISMKASGYLTNSKVKFLEDLVQTQNFSGKTRLLIL